jgi:transposase
MIPDELRSRVRRLFFAEHWKIGTIAQELRVHHDAVERALDPKSFTNRRWAAKAMALEPYKAFIGATLEQYPRLRATRLFEMIEDRGYTGSVSVLRRYVRKVRPVSRHEAFFRLSVLPGEQAQVDWGSFGKIRIGKGERLLSCFVMVLAWSRATFARFTLDQTLESFVRCHVEGFERFGGVPRAVLYDNLKSVVLERHGDLIRFHPRILELAGHCHFAPKPVAIARGNEKPRVERRIRDLRESFFAARSFGSLEDLNRQLDAWLERIVHARRVPGDDERTVREALIEERERLLPLPKHPFSADFVRPVASGKTPYIRFDRNDYSIPHALVRKPLTLVASEKAVRILDGDREVARHDRSWDRGRQIEREEHLAALAAEKRKAREQRGRNRLSAACPHATPFLGSVALHGGHLGGTTSRLLRLLDQYGAVELDAALHEAHRRGAFAAHSVAHILDQRRRSRGSPIPLDVVLPDDPRVRDLVLTPHSLGSYDRLANAGVAAQHDDGSENVATKEDRHD